MMKFITANTEFHMKCKYSSQVEKRIREIISSKPALYLYLYLCPYLCPSSEKEKDTRWRYENLGG